MQEMEQNELNHNLHNSLSAMGLAVKHMARLISALYEEYERAKNTIKELDKCKECTKE